MNNRKSIRKLYELIDEDFGKELVATSKYNEILNRSIEFEKQLKHSVSSSEFKIFENFLECENEMRLFEQEEYFVKGFITAYQLLIDSLR